MSSPQRLLTAAVLTGLLASLYVGAPGIVSVAQAEPAFAGSGVPQELVHRGDEVTATGSGFGSSAQPVLIGGAVVREYLSWSDTSFTVVIPWNADAGDQPLSIAAVPADSAPQAWPLREDLVPARSVGTLHVANFTLPTSASVPGSVIMRIGINASSQDVASRNDLEDVTPLYPLASGDTSNLPQVTALTARLSRYFKVSVPAGEEASSIAKLASDTAVEWVEPATDQAAVPAGVTVTDPLAAGQQGNLDTIEARFAWEYARGHASAVFGANTQTATIGIIDSGGDSGHEDLAGKILSQRDETGEGTTVDTCGHGTHVTGIAAAATNNAKGVAGVGYNATVREYRVFRTGCIGTDTAFIAAIGHAMGDGVQVVNMSLGAEFPEFACPAAMGDAITAAFNAGIDVVVSAGNSGQIDGARLRWPASCAHVVSVGNVDNNRVFAPNSSFAPGVSISAPGQAIASTMTGFDRSVRCSDGTGANNAYALCSGTSMAAPHVAGSLALLASVGVARAQREALLLTPAYTAGGVVGCPAAGNCGVGVLDIGKVMQGWDRGRWPAGYDNRGGALAKGLTAASWGANRLDFFAVNSAQHLIQQAYAGSGSGWSAWVDKGAPGTLIPGMSKPGAVSWGPNRIDVFVTGSDGHLWQYSWTGTSWSGWVDMGAPLGGLRSGPEVTSQGASKLDVFAVGNDGKLWHKAYNAGWQAWESSWTGLPSGVTFTGDPAAASWGSGRLDVFARGSDNALWHRGKSASTFGPWESLGGTLAGSPDASSWGTSRLDVYVLASGGLLQHVWYNGNGFSHFDTQGSGLSGDPGGVSWSPGRIDVMAPDANGVALHRTRLP